MQANTLVSNRLDNALKFNLDKIIKDTKERYKEGKTVEIMLDKSKVKAKIIKFYPYQVLVNIDNYNVGLTYIDFAKGARRCERDTKRIKPISKPNQRNQRARR